MTVRYPMQDRAGAVPALIGLVAAVYVIQSLMEEFPLRDGRQT